MESKFVWSATFVMVVTARLMVAARSLIWASLEPNDSVLSASCRMVPSMLARFLRPSFAINPVWAAMSLTSVIVRSSS